MSTIIDCTGPSLEIHQNLIMMMHQALSGPVKGFNKMLHIEIGHHIHMWETYSAL